MMVEASSANNWIHKCSVQHKTKEQNKFTFYKKQHVNKEKEKILKN